MQWLAVNLAGSDWDWLGQVGPLTYQVLKRNTNLGVRPTHAQIQVPATDLLHRTKQSALCSSLSSLTSVAEYTSAGHRTSGALNDTIPLYTLDKALSCDSKDSPHIPNYFLGHLSELLLFKLEPLVVFVQPPPSVCWVGRLPSVQTPGHERKQQPLPGGRRNREPACSPRAECWLVTRSILRWDTSSCAMGSCLHKASIICRPYNQQAPEAKLKLVSTVRLPETQNIRRSDASNQPPGQKGSMQSWPPVLLGGRTDSPAQWPDSVAQPG